MRHILGISGGKDSAALAVYLSQKTDWQYFVDLMSAFGLNEEAKHIEQQAAPPKIEYFLPIQAKNYPRYMNTCVCLRLI